ncbi:MAG TPA: SRPBCC family protein [Micromonosporaceae bacterium]|jgi:uncharacterized protein YndB with AHSA1/START domain
MTTVHITRTLSAPVDRVWTAFADADALASWFWPPRLAPKVAADVRVGGEFRIDATAGGFAASGTYQEVVPPTRLVMTWRWDGEDVDSLVTIELTARGDVTDLDLRHERLPSEQSRDEHAQGWNDCLDRLPGWLAA